MRINAAPLALTLLFLPFWSPAGPSKPPAFKERKVENTAFSPGEKISYKIKFAGMTGGTAVQEIAATEMIQGRRAFLIIFKAKTNRTFDVVRKIREEFQSWMDAESLCSLKYVENVREGSYGKNSETVIDPVRRRLAHTYKTSKSEGTTAADAPPFLQDPVSIVYFLRTLPLATGETYDIPTQSGGEVYHAKVSVKAVEKIRVPAGVFECFHVVPVLTGTEKPKGRMEIWLTADERRVPVLLKTRLAVGSFVATMTDYAPGGGEGRKP